MSSAAPSSVPRPSEIRAPISPSSGPRPAQAAVALSVSAQTLGSGQLPVPPVPAVLTSTAIRKRKRGEESDESDTEVPNGASRSVGAVLAVRKPKGKGKSTRSKRDDPSRVVQLTRETWVRRLIPVEGIPRCWDIPEDGDAVAFLWDLSGAEYDSRFNRPSDSMLSVFKDASLDAWTGGSAGSTKKSTKVPALDDLPCSKATHFCNGSWICDQLDPALLPDDFARYIADDAQQDEFYEALCDVNERQTQTPAPRNDGKHGFIGCTGFVVGQRGHRFVPIPKEVDETLLVELYNHDGVFQSINFGIEHSYCARILRPVSGAKGTHNCPYTTIAEDGRVTQGKMMERQCSARMEMWFPVDRAVRKAILIFENPHSHPQFPPTKVTAEGKDAINRAIAAQGSTIGLTVGKLDRAPTTAAILAAAPDPAFLDRRKKRKLIVDAKKLENPMGTDLTGVLHWQQKMQKECPREDWYVWSVSSEVDEEVVITMLPGLAAFIHDAKFTVHDFTYRRLHGVWKEWEVVMWYERLNIRICVCRIYAKHETERVFEKLWSGTFATFGRVTGREVKIKCVDGEGLLGIAMDGNKPQANALGKYLVGRNKPHLSGVFENDPQRMLAYVLRTCEFHLHRKFVDLAKTVPDPEMSTIWLAPTLKTHAAIDQFVEKCKRSEHACVRDWISDKDSIGWFWPSINEHLTKMPRDDSLLVPHHTNLNESSHPFTNQHTGTNLPLLEAIQLAYQVDLAQLKKINDARTARLVPNHRNTQAHRDHNNLKRREAHHQQAQDRAAARSELENIEEHMQELKERKKELKGSSGVTQLKRRGQKNRFERGLPTEAELAGDDGAEIAPELELHPTPRLTLDADLEPPSFPLTPYSEELYGFGPDIFAMY
ncbi:hypothetical protein MKEN_01023800 [Mycena kentingensis (nom. inval.)]|nr:hypothetical protein MKEN_01023800 [Mycena kentingensis (nom. inval.)]